MPRVTQQRVDTATIDEDGVSRGRQVFDVEAYSAIDAYLVLRQERGIDYGTIYRNLIGESPDPRLKVLSILPEARTPPVLGKIALYEVDVQYASDAKKGGGGSRPNRGEVTYRWGSAFEEREVYLDRNGNAMLNPRKDVYEGITLPVPHRQLEASWWTRNVNLSWLFTFDAAINQGTWRIKGRYTVGDGMALCRGINPVDDESDPDWTLLTGAFEFAVPGEPYNPRKFPAFGIYGGKRRLLKADGSLANSAGEAKQESFEVVPAVRLKSFNSLPI